MIVDGRRMLSRLSDSWRTLLAGVVAVALVTTTGAPLAWSATADTGAGVPVVVSADSVPVVSDGVGSASPSASAGAVTSLWKTQVTKTEKFSWGGLATSVGMGAVSGFVGGAAGPVLGSVFRAVTSTGAGAAVVSAVRAGVQSVLSKTAGVAATIGQRVSTGFKSVLGGSKSTGSSAANGGSRIAANAAAGNAARDALAAAHPGSLIEQSFPTSIGTRRLDILTQSGLGIESKVGRTSLTSTIRSQIAKDSLLLENGDVTGIEWVFSRSGVTGQIGPTGPLADALSSAGIPWRLAP